MYRHGMPDFGRDSVINRLGQVSPVAAVEKSHVLNSLIAPISMHASDDLELQTASLLLSTRLLYRASTRGACFQLHLRNFTTVPSVLRVFAYLQGAAFAPDLAYRTCSGEASHLLSDSPPRTRGPPATILLLLAF
jgi:hypothetical protein